MSGPGPGTSTVICWSCGRADRGAGDACPRCGAPRNQVPQAPPPAPRCPACGTTAALGERSSCPSCGLAFPRPSPSAAASPPRSRRPVVAVAAVVVGTVLAAALLRGGPPPLEARWRLRAGGAVVGGPVLESTTVFVAT
ncbi:MAG: hypothetical protein M3P97_02610, partial [Actinomycetota bacterium]|nr:hypothetical protein [Actinomycetota bacterium]